MKRKKKFISPQEQYGEELWQRMCDGVEKVGEYYRALDKKRLSTKHMEFNELSGTISS